MGAIRTVCDRHAAATSSSPDPLRPPAARAELAPIDDAAVLVAGGAEQCRPAHPPVADFAVEQIGDRAAFVAHDDAAARGPRIEPLTGPSNPAER